ncbi:MAG: FkbM family methyltransferase [Verrucomicrobia bacterium]|nr:FkbM family methyltransferase [Verrucomicrobiota bacterium]
MTIVDVGANQGIYTLFLSRLAAPARIFAFEPEPFVYQQLLEEIILLLEYWPYGLCQSGSSASRLLAFLEDNGFCLWRLFAGKVQREKADSFIQRQRGKSYCNIVAARKSLNL